PPWRGPGGWSKLETSWAGISQAAGEAQEARARILTSCWSEGGAGAQTRTARFPGKRAALGVSAQAGEEGSCPRQRMKRGRLGGLHLRSDDRNAVRDRREAFVRQLDDEFAGLRGLRNRGVERLLA